MRLYTLKWSRLQFLVPHYFPNSSRVTPVHQILNTSRAKLNRKWVPFPGTLLPPSVVAGIQAERRFLWALLTQRPLDGWALLLTIGWDRRLLLEPGSWGGATLLPQRALQPWVLDWVPDWVPYGRPLCFTPLLFVELVRRVFNKPSSLLQILPSFPFLESLAWLEIFIHSFT